MQSGLNFLQIPGPQKRGEDALRGLILECFSTSAGA